MRWLSVCGDGIREGAEICDDGNKIDGDGCSSECKVESGWTCTPTSPSRCHNSGSGGGEPVPRPPPPPPPVQPTPVPEHVVNPPPSYTPPPYEPTPQQPSESTSVSSTWINKNGAGAGTYVLTVVVCCLVIWIVGSWQLRVLGMGFSPSFPFCACDISSVSQRLCSDGCNSDACDRFTSGREPRAALGHQRLTKKTCRGIGL